jgi:hypothetical protein
VLTTRRITITSLVALLLTTGLLLPAAIAKRPARYPPELQKAEQMVDGWLKRLSHRSQQEVESLLGSPDEMATWSASGKSGPKLVYRFSPSVQLELLMSDGQVLTVLYQHRVIL